MNTNHIKLYGLRIGNKIIIGGFEIPTQYISYFSLKFKCNKHKSLLLVTLEFDNELI